MTVAACPSPTPLRRSIAPLFAQTTTSVWTGVYTTEQATRGTDLYQRVCSECHGDDLEGRERSPRARRQLVRAAVGRRDAEKAVRAHAGDAARDPGKRLQPNQYATSSRFC
jgi:mono/diheme cytochrome c family protein